MKKNQPLSSRAIRTFKRCVYAYYKKHGRDLPWRRTSDPYKILVSEIMLQQTQVTRAITKYKEFIGEFGNVGTLARAPLRKILTVWQGLGYNRRAKALKNIAQELVRQHNSTVPHRVDALMSLPGIGKTSASAIVAFSFQQPVVFIETNIRSVFIHHFYKKRNEVSDDEILPLVVQTLDVSNPRDWYYALMDYGAALKKSHVN